MGFLTKFTSSQWLLIVILILVSSLTYPRIGRTFLWGDEAYRALLGVNTAKVGWPTHLNNGGYVVGVELKDSVSTHFPDQYIDVASGWLQYYLIAVAYILFGQSTWSTRILFWLAGILVIGVNYHYRTLFKKPVKFFLVSSVLLVANVQFLIYLRQANYYILAILLTILSCLFFLKNIYQKDEPAVKDWIQLLMINQLLLHSHIPTFAAVFSVQGLYMVYRRIMRGYKRVYLDLIYFLISAAVSLMGYWLYSNNNIVYGRQFWSRVLNYLMDINFYFLPLTGLIVAVGLVIINLKKIPHKNVLLFVCLVSVLEIFLIAFFNPENGVAFRYVSSLMGLWVLGLSLVIISVTDKWRWLILILAVLACWWTGPAKASMLLVPEKWLSRVRQDFPTIPLAVDSRDKCYYGEYLDSLIGNYLHPMEEIISVLNQLKINNQKIVLGTCEGNTVMFYTDNLVINQLPQGMYERMYGRVYDYHEADLIIADPFCPQIMDYQGLIDEGYEWAVLKLSSPVIINSEGLNVRGKLFYPEQPLAYFLTQNATVKAKLQQLK